MAHLAFALPDFKGMLEVDLPHLSNGTVHGKNLNVGIQDIEDITPSDEEMLIRIYQLDIPFRQGGYPADLKEIRINNEIVSMLWYPPCPGEPTKTRESPDQAWDVLQKMEFFTIKDSRSIPDYPDILDGVFLVIQIKTANAFREFIFSNPQMYDSSDNSRLNASLSAIAAEFDTPACYAPGR